MRVVDYKSEQCCGCGLCAAICPTKAITLLENKVGFLEPNIDNKKCINCEVCWKQCSFQHQDRLIEPLRTFAAVRTDKLKLKRSSSGGLFSAISENMLSSNEWMICGCILDEMIEAKHIVTKEVEEVEKMYGSKYVQSNMEEVYSNILNALQLGKKVLFSGTPCQVAAIKKFTNKCENLYTIEIICHGVANQAMFTSYLKNLNIGEIREFCFRDKEQGWTFNNKMQLNDGSIVIKNHRLSSYMTYYLNSETYRESCYHCPYACQKRGADLTIGDFWGVINKCSYLRNKIDIDKGVSCVLVNTTKGEMLLTSGEIKCYPVNYEDIKEGNGPLNHPSTHSNKRAEILRLWKKDMNWKFIDNYWKKNDYRFSYKIWSMVPTNIQNIIRVMLGKR